MVGLAIALLLAGGTPAGLCSAPPEYYKVELVPTRRVPTARMATGVAHLTFAESPFGIAISGKGHYRYDVEVVVDNLRPVPGGQFVAWLSTPDLKQVVRLGTVEGPVRGRTEWNKFLVIITLEPPEPANRARWQGPVVMRGLSRSGLMHTMAGHGPYEQEPCAVYGYF